MGEVRLNGKLRSVPIFSQKYKDFGIIEKEFSRFE